MREIYDRGLQFLVASQTEAGDWQGGGQQGPGVTGMALMVLLASGEDPNFGLYANSVRRALRNIIGQQSASTGILGNSMYHHGFAMLALAEAYGAVDDRNLWNESDANRRTIGAVLELAVRGALTAQNKNQVGGWRYSPDSRDADTSVSGAVLVGLLAARNAGIEIPDEAIEKAIKYYTQMTSDAGQVAYAGGFGGFDESLARVSIATLVYSVARRKDLPQFKATLQFLTQRLENNSNQYAEYTALLPGPGVVPRGRRRLGEMEQATGAPIENGASRRRQRARAVRPNDRHVALDAGPGSELPLLTDLRAMSAMRNQREMAIQKDREQAAGRCLRRSCVGAAAALFVVLLLISTAKTRAADAENAERQPILHLQERDAATGQLADSVGPEKLLWQSSAFAAPLEFPIAALTDRTLSGERPYA